MALIACAECGRQISDRAVACPQCGCPNQPRDLGHPRDEAKTASGSTDERSIVGPAQTRAETTGCLLALILVGLGLVYVLAQAARSGRSVSPDAVAQTSYGAPTSHGKTGGRDCHSALIVESVGDTDARVTVAWFSASDPERSAAAKALLECLGADESATVNLRDPATNEIVYIATRAGAIPTPSERADAGPVLAEPTATSCRTLVADVPKPPFSDRDQAILNEVLSTSEPEDEVFRRMGKKYGISARAAEQAARRAQEGQFSNWGRKRDDAVRKAVACLLERCGLRLMNEPIITGGHVTVMADSSRGATDQMDSLARDILGLPGIATTLIDIRHNGERVGHHRYP